MQLIFSVKLNLHSSELLNTQGNQRLDKYCLAMFHLVLKRGTTEIILLFITAEISKNDNKIKEKTVLFEISLYLNGLR